MRVIQKIEAALATTIAALLVGGWVVTVGQLFFRGA